MSKCSCINCITPPHLLKKMLESSRPEIRKAALNTLMMTERLRGERFVRAATATALPGHARRTVYDAHNGGSLIAATVARTEDGPAPADGSVNRAFEGLGATRDFYRQVLGRNSIDNQGGRLDAYVHFSFEYNNAFWNGQQMVFGDGDGVAFDDFTRSLDVIAHELTHGVTEFSAGLDYHNQSGALNESMSDVFGSLVKQWRLGQAAAQADWLIGADVFTPGVGLDALRSLKAPGTAYNHPEFGRDPQPAHMKNYQHLPDTEAGDYGGVHINSGIPNHAFYRVTKALGGNAWDAPGLIWYDTLLAASPNTEFREFAEITMQKASARFGSGSRERAAVEAGWTDVGVIDPRARTISVAAANAFARASEFDALQVRIEELAREVAALSIARGANGDGRPKP